MWMLRLDGLCPQDRLAPCTGLCLHLLQQAPYCGRLSSPSPSQHGNGATSSSTGLPGGPMVLPNITFWRQNQGCTGKHLASGPLKK
jgi:hypothetical protein